jgi:hypothetical protein
LYIGVWFYEHPVINSTSVFLPFVHFYIYNYTKSSLYTKAASDAQIIMVSLDSGSIRFLVNEL